MESSSRIDASATFSIELKARRQSVSESRDLFAQALGAQLAKHHDEMLARQARARAASEKRSDSGMPPPTSIQRSPTPEAPQCAAALPGKSVNQESEAPDAKQRPVPRPPLAGAKSSPTTTSSNATTDTAPDTSAPEPGPAVAPAAKIAVKADAKGESEEMPLPLPQAAATDQPEVDPSPAAETVPAIPAAILPAVTQPNVTLPATNVLLLTGTPPSGDALAASDGADVLAATGLLAKLQPSQTVAKGAATANGQPVDPAPVDPTEHPELIGKPKPAEAADEGEAAPVAPKPKMQNNSPSTGSADGGDALNKPATPLLAMAAAASVQGSAGLGRGGLSEGLQMIDEGEIGSGDLELPGWSEPLGSGLANGLTRTVNLRTSAFLAELRQNVNVLPAHEQVAVQIQRAARNGMGRLTVDLQPAELGRVEIKMSVDKDKNVTASVVVDRPGTLDLLQRDVRNLERILQDAGLQTGAGSLSFSLRDPGSGGQGQSGGSGTSGRGQSASGEAVAPAAAARPDIVATADGYVDLET